MINPAADQRTFMARMIDFGTQAGMPPSTAKVIGYLLVCQPAMQSAHDIQIALKLSAGAINNALRMLTTSGLVRKTRFSQDRHHYYELDSDGWRRATLQRLQALTSAIRIADEGLLAYPENKRLQAMRETYQAFSDEFQHITERFGESRS